MQKQVVKIEPMIFNVPTKKRVAAYARVSDSKQAMQHSLVAQVRHYSEYINSRHNWIYTGVYADDAVTGTKDNRAEFKRLIKDCKDAKIDMIITKSISRFARNTVTLLKTVRELKEIGVDVYFENENIHSVSHEGELMLTILASYAQEQSLMVSESCKWSIRNRHKNGEIVSLSYLYGYKIVKRQPKINKKEAEVVKLIYSLFLEGKAASAIAKELSQREVLNPSKTSTRWHTHTVSSILKNEKYKGEAILQKTYTVDFLDTSRKRNK